MDYPYPTVFGSDVPWTAKSTMPLNIRAWRALSRALSSATSVRWLRGMLRSRRRKAPCTADTSTAITANSVGMQHRIIVSIFKLRVVLGFVLPNENGEGLGAL